MLRYLLAFMVVASACSVLASPVRRQDYQRASSGPAPAPASPKGPGAFRAEKAAMHLHNAAHATKETAAYSTLGVVGFSGSAKAPIEAANELRKGDKDYAAHKLGQAGKRWQHGLALSSNGVVINGARAVKHTACAVGQACGYIGDKISGRKDTPKERAERYQANGEKLQEAKAESSERRKEITHLRKDATRDMLGMDPKTRH